MIIVLVLILLVCVFEADGYLSFIPSDKRLLHAVKRVRHNIGMSTNQFELMESDKLICVDSHDNLIQVQSKRHCHMFTATNPVGVAHRAFSVFIFNAEGKMLLHQRAASKITFPSVWTNACCSHPLHPQESDDQAAILDGSIPGIRKAAIRKLQDELGIDSSLIKPRDFRFLTRIYYHAVDKNRKDNRANEGFDWGENEIDYILFLKGDFPLNLNPEEVQQVSYVDQKELKELMKNPALSWSPWFYAMANDESLLPRWWKNLDKVFHSNELEDHRNIVQLGNVA